MEPITTETDTAKAGNDGKEVFEETSVIDDKVIMDLAKRRLSAKRGLVSQAVDFFLICFCMFILILADYVEQRIFVALLFCTFWGIRLLIRIFKFAKPAFKDGIAAFFRERQEREIESEYNRLRRMSTERIVGELNK